MMRPRNLAFLKRFLKDRLVLGELSIPAQSSYELPKEVFNYERKGYISKQVTGAEDKKILREMCADFFKVGVVPTALGMDKAGPDSLMGKLIQKEIDLHIDSGMSTLYLYAKNGNHCGFNLNVIWDVDPDYESFEVLPQSWFAACGQVANEEANNDEEAMVIFRSLTQLYDYHYAHFMATKLNLEKIFRYWTIYFSKEHRGVGNFALAMPALTLCPKEILLAGRITIKNPPEQIKGLQTVAVSFDYHLWYQRPWLPYYEIDFKRGSKSVFGDVDQSLGQAWIFLLQSDIHKKYIE